MTEFNVKFETPDQFKVVFDKNEEFSVKFDKNEEFKVSYADVGPQGPQGAQGQYEVYLYLPDTEQNGPATPTDVIWMESDTNILGVLSGPNVAGWGLIVPDTESDVWVTRARYDPKIHNQIDEWSATYQAGAAGQSATVQVGTVESVPNDSETSIDNTGTATDAIFNFKIQRGADGIGRAQVDTDSPTDETLGNLWQDEGDTNKLYYFDTETNVWVDASPYVFDSINITPEIFVQSLTVSADGRTITATDHAGVVTTYTSPFTANDESKLDGIEANADVTPSWVPDVDPNYIDGIAADDFIGDGVTITDSDSKVKITGSTLSASEFIAGDGISITDSDSKVKVSNTVVVPNTAGYPLGYDTEVVIGTTSTWVKPEGVTQIALKVIGSGITTTNSNLSVAHMTGLWEVKQLSNASANYSVVIGPASSSTTPNGRTFINGIQFSLACANARAFNSSNTDFVTSINNITINSNVSVFQLFAAGNIYNNDNIISTGSHVLGSAGLTSGFIDGTTKYGLCSVGGSGPATTGCVVIWYKKPGGA